MKKIILILLILSMVSAAACADNEPTANNSAGGTQANTDTQHGEPAGPERTYYDELGERDFEGDTFTVLDANYNPDLWANTPEELTGEPVNDALITRNRFIEDKYNINIKYIQIAGYNTGTQSLRNSVAAGENLYDMVISTILGGNLDTLSQSSVLYNLASMPYLSLESPWWSSLIYNNMIFNGRLFYTAGDIVPSMYQAPAAMFVNRKLMQDYGIQENLYDLVFAGQWTIDVLEKLTKDMDTDLNQDGNLTGEEDFFGLINEHNVLSSNALTTAMGVKLSTVRENNIFIELNLPASIERIERLADFMRTIPHQSHINSIFAESRALFYAHYLESALLYLRGMEDDYGILPMPKYNEQQESYYSFLNAWNSSFIGVPLHANTDKAGFIMEALAYASYETVRPSIYEIALKTKVTRDSESAQAIDIIIESSYMDLNGIYNLGNSTEIVRRAIFEKAPLVSAYEAAEGSIQTAIERFIETMSE